LGGFAQAAEANSDAAREFITGTAFFRIAYAVLPYLALLNLLWVLPLWKWRRLAARRKV